MVDIKIYPIIDNTMLVLFHVGVCFRFFILDGRITFFTQNMDLATIQKSTITFLFKSEIL
jgi:hypothetical protein